MAGRSSAQPAEMTRVMWARGNFSRTAAMAGVVRTRSPIRLSWMRRMFIQLLLVLVILLVLQAVRLRARAGARARAGVKERWQSAPQLHRTLIRTEQPRPEMVPGEIVHDPLPRRQAHPFDRFRVIVQMPDRFGERIDIGRRNDQSLDVMGDDVAGLARRDLRQAAGRRFVGDFGTAFALRGEDVRRRLAQIF